jgi:hypothetical protein
MIKTKFNTARFTKDMNNIVKYSEGFLEGAQRGKVVFLKGLGVKTVELLKEYVDSNARVNPEALHHVYEWYKVGNPSARLFEINYTVSNLGLSFVSEFKQSTTIKNGSREPFYQKATIMESGMSLKIRPKSSQVLAFEVDGSEVFSKTEVTVDNPGGSQVAGSFERVFNLFFTQYFTQAFLRSSGLFDFFENPVVYKKDLPIGKKLGKQKGLSTGYRWVANAGVGR